MMAGFSMEYSALLYCSFELHTYVSSLTFLYVVMHACMYVCVRACMHMHVHSMYVCLCECNANYLASYIDNL